ncbi:MAG TPA: asparagine synthase-related protein, partial [bacterium]|nr:asparagine synthase-related protein [bacterium]
VDSMGHAHGIETRSPLVDRRILDVLCRAPGHVKAPDGQLRHLMFQALGDRLLERTKTRRKMSFIVPMDLWARRELRGIIDTVLSPDVIRRRGVFNPQAVEAVKAAFYDTGRERHPFKVWNLALFELWCRFHLDAPPGSSVPETVEDLV